MTQNSKHIELVTEIGERDIYASAQLIIQKYGLKGASHYAADKIACFRQQGNPEGMRVWGRIRAALLNLSDIRFKDDLIH